MAKKLKRSDTLIARKDNIHRFKCEYCGCTNYKRINSPIAIFMSMIGYCTGCGSPIYKDSPPKDGFCVERKEEKCCVEWTDEVYIVGIPIRKKGKGHV